MPSLAINFSQINNKTSPSFPASEQEVEGAGEKETD